MTALLDHCPACGHRALSRFYEVRDVPVNSVLLLDDEEQARRFPVADITLKSCEACTFVFNAAFDPAMTEYSGRYESTQAFSKTFVEFNEELARGLIERHGLYNKTVLEIGCGDGDFLRLLCTLGQNRGVGYDPAYEPGRHRAVDGVEFVSEFFTGASGNHGADLVVCKMTLEHISDVGGFARSLRDALDGNTETVVFLQVPNARYVFGELAFWDVYYEHCSYFSAASLQHLFERSGFDVLNTWTGYEDQYLMLEARLAESPATLSGPPNAVRQELAKEADRFANTVTERMEGWRTRLEGYAAGGKRVALWGAGSKAVAFLAALEPTAGIEIAVDINPNKAGTYLPRTAHRIISPAELVQANPDVVIVMNPIYREEIQRCLQDLGLAPELLTV